MNLPHFKSMIKPDQCPFLSQIKGYIWEFIVLKTKKKKLKKKLNT